MSELDRCDRCMHRRQHHHGPVRVDGSWLEDSAGPCWSKRCTEDGAERCPSFVEPAKLVE